MEPGTASVFGEEEAGLGEPLREPSKPPFVSFHKRITTKAGEGRGSSVAAVLLCLL